MTGGLTGVNGLTTIPSLLIHGMMYIVCLNRSENVLCCHRRNSKLLISFIIKLIILNETRLSILDI